MTTLFTGANRPNFRRIPSVRHPALQVGRTFRRALESNLPVLHALQHQLHTNCQNGDIPTRHRVHHSPSRARDVATEQSAQNKRTKDFESVLEERHELADSKVSEKASTFSCLDRLTSTKSSTDTSRKSTTTC